MSTHPPLIHVHQTLTACPSEWSAWDPDGNWYYLRYRFGRGTVEVCQGGPAPGMDHLVYVDALSHATLIAEFHHGHELDGEIGLDEFLELAGMEQA